MPLLGVGRFLDNAVVFRNIWFRGRLGGGKTLGSVAFASHLIKQGVYKYALANMPLALPAPPDGFLYDCVVIYDEAWVDMDARSFMSNPRQYGAFARKLRTCWFYPSVFGVDKRLRPVWVERKWMIDFFPGQLWVYKWGVDLGYSSDEGVFFLWRPSAYFKLYDHSYIPGTGEEWQQLENALKATYQDCGFDPARLFGRSDGGKR